MTASAAAPVSFDESGERLQGLAEVEVSAQQVERAESLPASASGHERRRKVLSRMCCPTISQRRSSCHPRFKVNVMTLR